jgi:hypothetical protein
MKKYLWLSLIAIALLLSSGAFSDQSTSKPLAPSVTARNQQNDVQPDQATLEKSKQQLEGVVKKDQKVQESSADQRSLEEYKQRIATQSSQPAAKSQVFELKDPEDVKKDQEYRQRSLQQEPPEAEASRYDNNGKLIEEHAVRPFNRIAETSERPVTLQETQVLFEDFNNWGPWGDNPPSGWAVIDSGYLPHWDNNDWHKYYYSSWTSNCARAYYSPIENQDEWLIASAINASGYSNLHLNFKSYLSLPDSSDVLGSTDGGSNWITIARYTTAHTTTTWDYDISSWADGQSSVIIAFRYMDYNGLYWYIDDVTIQEDDGVNPVNVVFSEDFEGTWGPYGDNPPAGWTIIDNGDYTYPPEAWDNNDWHKYVQWGDTTARVYYYSATGSEVMNEWLISPAMDFSPTSTTSYDQILLKFKHYYYDGGVTAEDTGFVMVYDGSNWSTEAMYISTTANPAYASVDITSYANGNSGVKIAFKYVGYSDYYWIVDSVQVIGVELPDHDVEATAILAPGSIIIEGYDWDVSSRFTNLGTNTESFTAYYDINTLSLTPFFSEDFETGLPVTWTVIDTLDDYPITWVTSTVHDATWPGEVRSSSWWNGVYMIADSDAPSSTVPDMSEQLLTPWIDCSIYTNIYLYFTHFYDHMGDQFGDVDIRTSAGDAWTNLMHYTDVDYEGEVSLSISAIADGQDSVQIRFWYHTTGYNWYWGIDNVKLATGTITTVYSDTEPVTGLVSLAYEDVVFNDFAPSSPGTYYLKTYHNTAGDADNTNDTLYSTTTCYPHVGSGGPDAGYYIWEDNINGTGGAYNWIDITTIGTAVTWSGGSGEDRFTYGIPLGFNFFFYGSNYSRIFLSEDGHASFDTMTSSNSSNYSIPNTSGPGNMLAFLWDELSGVTSGTAYYYTNNTDTFIVSYIDWDFGTDLNQRIDVQFILSAADNNIKFQYQEVGPVIYTSHTIGIENVDETIGLEYVYNGDPIGNIAMTGLAITFSYDPPAHDVAAVDILEPLDGVEANVSFTPTAVFGNIGINTETFNVHFHIADASGANVYSNMQTVTALASTAIDTVQFTSHSISTVGNYTCSTYTALGTDLDPANDTLVSTFSVDVHYGTSSPDDFGYRWIDNYTSPTTLEDPPVYSWVDITGVGTPITTWTGSADDGYIDPILMGLSFWYYGDSYDSLVISTNGWVSFLRQTSNYLGNYQPGTGHDPTAGVFPNWDDLDGYTAGTVYYYYDSAGNRFIVSWIDWAYHGDSTNACDFQVILDADDSTLVFQYGTAADGSYQTDITVGIQDSSKTIGLSYYNEGNPTLNIPYDGLAIKFYYEPYIHDMAALQFLSPPRLGNVGDPVTPQVEVKNRGLANETSVPVTLDIPLLSYSETIYMDINAGIIDTAVFPQFTTTTGGAYKLTAYTNLGTDEDNSNDTLSMLYLVPLQVFDFEITDGNLSPTGDWQYGTPSSGPDSAYSGTKLWATNLAGNYTSGIHTLQFELSLGSLGPAFGFYQWYDTEVRYDGGNFAISTDDGTNWITISPDIGYDDTTNTTNPLSRDSIFTGHDIGEMWNLVFFDLSAYAGMDVDARLAFGADGSVYYPGWYVDDFTFIDCSFFMFDHDVLVSEVISPPATGMSGTAVTPQVKVANMGKNDEATVPVTLEIPALTYSQTVNVSVDSGSTEIATFPDFTPTSGGIYELTFYTNLGTDEDTSNDTLLFTYTAYDQILDFEASGSGLAASGDWEWGTPSATYGPGSAYSGSNLWATVLDTSYTTGLHTLSFQIECGSTNPTFGLAQWYDTEANYDGGNFAVSVNAGTTWTVISPDIGYELTANSSNPLYPDSIFSGHDVGEMWHFASFDLSAYAGSIIDARLAFGTDGSVYYPGWYVDDFAFIDCELFFPDDDVKIVSLDGPSNGILLNVDVTVTLFNLGLNTQTFYLRVTDGQGFADSIQVVDLVQFETRQVTLTTWNPTTACVDYNLLAEAVIPADEYPGDNSISRLLRKAKPHNTTLAWDDGVLQDAGYYLDTGPPPDNAMATEFVSLYPGELTHAAAYFLSAGDPYYPWPDAQNDFIDMVLYIDADDDNVPDSLPIDTIRVIGDDIGDGWVYGVFDCGHTFNPGDHFWVGIWQVVNEGGSEGLGIDGSREYEQYQWARSDGAWINPAPYPFDGGDFMIRAFMDYDTTQHANMVITPSEIEKDADAGTVVYDTIIVNNTGNLPLTYTAAEVMFTSTRNLTTDLTLYAYNFDDGTLPAGWSIIDGGTSTATWEYGSTHDTHCTARSSPYWTDDYMIVDSDCAGSGVTMDEELITTYFDVSTSPTVILAFDFHFNWYSAGNDEVCDIDVRNGAGAAWTTVLSYSGADDSGHVEIDITSFIGTADSVQVRFHYYNAVYEMFWGIDNFELYEPTGPWLVIDYHGGTLPAGEADTIQATLDATALPDGFYFGEISFVGDDPINPSDVVPVWLKVGGSGFVSGTVYDYNTTDPIEGATITAGAYSDVSLSNGGYNIEITPGTYDVFCEADYYSPDSAMSQVVARDATTTVNFVLTSPIATINTDSVIYEPGTIADEGDTLRFSRNLSNTGSAPLDYSVRINYVSPTGTMLAVPEVSIVKKATKVLRAPDEKSVDNSAEHSPYLSNEPNAPLITDFGDTVFWFDPQTPVSETQCLGVEFDGIYFWVTGGNSGSTPNKLYKYDHNGNHVATYDQTSLESWGWRDLAWDGTYLYASDSTELAIIDPATGLEIGNLPRPSGFTTVPCRALAYDPATDHFWAANWSSNIVEFDRTGATINSYSNSKSAYGMAWDDVSDGGPFLWVFSQDGDPAPLIQVSQFSPATGTYTGVVFQGVVPAGYSVDPDSTMAGGACFTTEWDPTKAILFTLNQSRPTDFVMGYEIAPYSTWLTCTANCEGTLDPTTAENVDIEFFIDLTTYSRDTTLFADIKIENNSQDQPVIPVRAGQGPGTLQGTVTDASTTDPIESVFVEVEGLGISTYTNDMGQYILYVFPPNTYSVSFEHADYQDTTVTDVVITSGGITVLDVEMTPAVTCFNYLPGDVNMYNGVWPPNPVVGADATYLINFFRGFTTSHACYMNNPSAPVLWPNGQPGQYFWASADVNGDCQVIGADVTKLINYLRGSGTLSYCVEYEPCWHNAGEVPGSAPGDWPNCQTPPPVSIKVLPTNLNR